MSKLLNLLKQIGRKPSKRVSLSPNDLIESARNSLVAGDLAAASLACEECLELDPDNADALHLLGLAAYRAEDWSRALDLLQRSMAINPDSADLQNNLGNLYSILGRCEEAENVLRSALRLDPKHVSARENLLFILPFLEKTSGDLMRREHDAWAALHVRLAPRVDRQPVRDAAAPLRIGYVSADFRQSAVGFFIEPVIAAHDRERFEIFCYYNDTREDAYTRRFRASASAWRETAALGDEAMAELIRDDRIDILVDLSGHLKGNRLQVFARRPAPLQMTYLGYSLSTGLAAFDYRISDALCDPPGLTEAHYVETVLRLPGCMWCYQPPMEGPPVGPLPALANGAFTFGSTNNPAKITLRMLKVWGRILGELPQSRMIVAVMPEYGRQRIKDALATCGVAPERIEFHDRLAREKFLALHDRIDVLLDTFPCNGGTTLCDALWQGVPAVCMTGDWMPARAAASLYAAVGLNDLAVRSEDEYVNAAVRLASDPAGTAALRAGMRDRLRASPLLDAAGFTRRLEALYLDTWTRGPSAP